MKDQKYWQRRAVRYERDWNKCCAETVEKRLARHYERALSAIKDDILQLYATFAKDNGLDFNEARRALSSREFREWRMSMREYIEANDAGLTRELNNLAMNPRITRLEKLYGETLQELDRMGRKFDDDMRNFLSDAYKSNYSRDIFDLVKVGGMAVTWAKVDSPSVEKVLAARWSGKNYSQRVWTNTRLLSRVVRETVATGVHRGLSIPQLSRMVEDKMHAGYSSAVNLVRTEMSFVNNQAHADSMEAAGIKWYEFIATLDNRTSAPCRSRDGEAYPLEEKTVGFNYPPLHPRCRSTVAPFIDGVSKSGTRIAKVGKDTIHIPASMSYRDYEAVYVKKTQTFEQWQQLHEAKQNTRINFVEYKKVIQNRTISEFTALANELKPLVEQYVGKPSKWSGKIVFGNGSHKLWNCDIQLESDVPKHVLLHELIHSCSISYYDQKTFIANTLQEEIAVQFLCQELSKLKGIDIVRNACDNAIDLIRKINKALSLPKTNLELAADLIRQPVSERWDYLADLAGSTCANKTVREAETLFKMIEVLKAWNPPK